MLKLVRQTVHETEIKKSRFIASSIPVSTVEQAVSSFENVKNDSATHNCFAYRIGGFYRFSDDGEPSGTAGRPILSAIDRQSVNHVIVIVTRFYGGIKLGSGGLVRAYSNAAAQCLQKAEKIELVEKTSISFCVPFDSINPVFALIEKFNAKKKEQTFKEEGACFDIEIARRDSDEFVQSLKCGTLGKVRFMNNDN